VSARAVIGRAGNGPLGNGRTARRVLLAATAGLLAAGLAACGAPAPTPPPPPAVPVANPGPLAVVAPVVIPPPVALPAPPARTRAATPRPTTTTPAAPAGPAGRTIPMTVTFYAAHDNDPPGSREIAYPQKHSQAGGRGTYADPITVATDRRELAPGTLIYVPFVARYFVMEDGCVECTEDWEASRLRHIDLYAGNATDSGVLACEEALTPSGHVPIEVGPPAGRRVDTRPFYSGGDCLDL